MITNIDSANMDNNKKKPQATTNMHLAISAVSRARQNVEIGPSHISLMKNEAFRGRDYSLQNSYNEAQNLSLLLLPFPDFKGILFCI